MEGFEAMSLCSQDFEHSARFPLRFSSRYPLSYPLSFPPAHAKGWVVLKDKL